MNVMAIEPKIVSGHWEYLFTTENPNYFKEWIEQRLLQQSIYMPVYCIQPFGLDTKERRHIRVIRGVFSVWRSPPSED